MPIMSPAQPVRLRSAAVPFWLRLRIHRSHARLRSSCCRSWISVNWSSREETVVRETEAAEGLEGSPLDVAEVDPEPPAVELVMLEGVGRLEAGSREGELDGCREDAPRDETGCVSLPVMGRAGDGLSLSEMLPLWA